MSYFSSFVISLALASSLSLSVANAQTADNPDSEFVRILFNNLSGAVPDFEAEARNSAAYRDADEFSRASVIDEVATRLREQYADIATYENMILDVRTTLGEWDAERNAFPITLFQPGTYVQVGPGVSFTNSIEARFWSMPIDLAQDIPSRISSTRSVIVEVRLSNLQVTVENARRVSGEITEVVIKTTEGEELGSYKVEPARQIDNSIDQGLVARQLIDTLQVPQLGSELEAGFAWAQANAVGVAWSVRGFSGPVTYEGVNEWPYTNFVPNADVVRVGFSSSDNGAKGILSSRGFNINGLTSPQFFGNQLNCFTADISDRCGVMTFTKEGNTHILKEIIILDDFERTNFREVTKSILGDSIAAFEYDEETPTSVGTTVAYRYDGELYYLGQREAGGIPGLDVRSGFRNNYHAPVMLFGFEGNDGRAISLARVSALPDGSNVVITQAGPDVQQGNSDDGRITVVPE